MGQEPDEQSGGHAHDDGGKEVKPRLLIFFDYACSFCYVDQFRFDRLAEDRSVETILCPFELRPDMPEEGISIAEHGLAHSEKVDEHLQRVAREEGFPLVLPDLLPNTHKALALGEVGRDAGPETHARVHKAIFSAYFGEGRDIGSREVLLGVAEASGLDVDQVRAAWDEGLYDERLHQFRHIALHLGIDATPAALICNELLIGSRPYKVLSDALDRCALSQEA